MSKTIRSHPLRFLRAIFNKKRAHERTPRNAMVQLFSETAHLGPADLIDESEGGAKVMAQSPFVLEDAVFLLNPATATVHMVQLAWRTGREAGFRYMEERNLRIYVDDPRLQHIGAYWAAIRLNNAASAPGGVFGRRQ